MKLAKIRARDLRAPRFFWHSWITTEQSGFRHPHIAIRPTHHMSENILVFRWQLSPKHDSAGTATHIVGAYAPQVEMPLNPYYADTAMPVLKKIRKIMGQGDSLADLLRALKKMGIPRHVYTGAFQCVPRRYKERSQEFLTAQNMIEAA